MRKILVIFTFLIIAAGCKNDIIEPVEIFEIGSGQDYGIYNKVLQNLSTDKSHLVVINDSTQKDYISGLNIKYSTDNIPELSVETIESYVSLNQTKIKLKKIPGINHIFKSEYKNTSSKTINVFISRIGYNALKTQAVVTVGIVYGPLAGLGTLFYLERSGDEWQVKKTLNTWVS
jgi:hypothetical protein